MSKHTPGPWRIDPRSIGTPWNVGTDEQDVALASQLVGDDLKQSERTANARLIAAAPRLLAALRSILAGGSRAAIRSVARAAIAAATGEED